MYNKSYKALLQGKYLECVLLTRQNRNKTFFLHVTLSSETVPRMYFYLFNHTKRVVLLPNYTDQIIITIIFFFFFETMHTVQNFLWAQDHRTGFLNFFFFLIYLFIFLHSKEFLQVNTQQKCILTSETIKTENFFLNHNVVYEWYFL